MRNYLEVLNKLTILYIEDEEPVRKEMAKLLSYVFKDIISAVDGLDGINKFKENKDNIDIILSDISMPKLNGVEMMKEIKKINNTIPTVFLTAHDEKDYLLESINMQITQYIIKPIDGNDLLDKIYTAYLPTLHNKQIEEKNIELEKLNAQIIKESEEKVKRIIKEQAKTKSMNDFFNAHTISLELDLEGKITYVSELFLNISKFKKEELHGEFYDIVRFECKNNEFDEIKQSIEKKGYWKEKVKNIKKDNGHYWLESVIYPILNSDEEIESYKSIEIDISNLKKLEESLGLLIDEEDEFDFSTLI